MKVWISGPMTGKPMFNRPAFQKAAFELEAHGFDVMTPFDLDWNNPVSGAPVGSDEYLRFLRQDIHEILTRDMIVLLPGSENSYGARLEWDLARKLHIPVRRYAPGATNGIGHLWKLIGLSGKKRAGKDSAAELIGLPRVGFADVLKEEALRIDPVVDFTTADWRGITLSEIVDSYGWTQAKKHTQVRRFLQELGVARREQQEDYWIRQLEARLTLGGEYVVSDVRFPNEARWIEDQHGLLLRIERPSLDGRDQHSSEIAMDEWPWLPGQIVRNEIEGDGWRDHLRAALVRSDLGEWAGFHGVDLALTRPTV